MYGAILTGPITEGVDFGTFFLHNEGYSTMCGHAIIALTKLVLETGIIPREGPEVELNIDAPPGRIVSRARFVDGKVSDIKFTNVPSFVLYSNQELELEGKKLSFDVAYGGAFYAVVNDPELPLNSANASELIRLGRMVKRLVSEKLKIVHPFEDELSFLYGTIFTGKAYEQRHHSRNVCIFADGELDRSPTGSGVSARAAIHYSRGELSDMEWITIESILGSLMKVRVAGIREYGAYKAVIPEVSGTAHFTGKSEFWFDPEDPLKEGFIIR
jgi:trans-L-3-hydroxyproline dehydratase